MYGLGVEIAPTPSVWESIGSAIGAIGIGLLAQKQQEKVLKAKEKAEAKQLAAEIAAAQAATDAQIAAMAAQQPAMSKTFAGLPLWAWIAVPGLGAVAYFLVRRRRAYGRRRR